MKMKMGKVDTILRFFREVVEKEDIDVLDEIIHPNYSAKPMTRDKAASKLSLIDETKLQHNGIEGIKQRQIELFEQFSDFNVDITDIVEDQDTVVIFYTMKFTHIGVWNNFEPTGRRISIAAVNLFRFNDDKIFEIKAMLGTIDLLKQIGAHVDSKDEEEVKEYLQLLKDFIYNK